MIDFRYHLVSLMAVLVALTIGVILGAGPLQGPLSETLTGQVDKLTQRQAELTEQNSHLEASLAESQEFISDTSALTVSGTLKDVPVALVKTSDASEDAVEDMTRLLAAAGAKVNVTAQLEPAWFATDAEGTRQALAKRLTGYLGDRVSAKSSDADILATGLFVALTTGDDTTKVIRDVLATSDAKLATVSGTTPAQAVVLVTGTNADLGKATGVGKDPLMIRATARSLARAPGSAIIVGDATTEKDYVALVRHASLGVATADTIASSRGRVNAVLGLVAARAGNAAAFGTGLGATQAVAGGGQS